MNKKVDRMGEILILQGLSAPSEYKCPVFAQVPVVNRLNMQNLWQVFGLWGSRVWGTVLTDWLSFGLSQKRAGIPLPQMYQINICYASFMF